MKPAGIHHVAILVDDADKASAFYATCSASRSCGARRGTHPRRLVRCGGEELHLMQPDNQTMNPPHFAICVDDLASAVAAIREHGVTVYEVEHMPGAGYQAVLTDPSGNLIELNQPE